MKEFIFNIKALSGSDPKRIIIKRIIFIIIYIAGVLFLSSGSGFCGEDKKIALVVSKKIRPYMDVVEGIKQGLEGKLKITQVFFLEDEGRFKSKKGDRFKSVPKFDLSVAIGPEATEFLWDSGAHSNGFPTAQKMFTAVLDPDKIAGTDLNKTKGTDLNLSPCGISLRIPVDRQVHEISKAFVQLKRIGLLFDAGNNDWFYEKARLAAQADHITIIPLIVESRNQITQVLTDNWENMDCVWMIPDRTVISEKIIQYIIKLGIYHKKGVIGYNSFFIRSGAVFSFDFDYKALGIQTAGKIETYFKTGSCKEESPEFQTVVNRKMVERLTITGDRFKSAPIPPVLGTDLNLSPRE